MPETPITLTIDTDDLSPQKLSDALRDFMGLLSEIDSDISETAARTLDWRVTAVSYNSPFTIRMVGRPRAGHRDNGPAVVRACVRGSAVLVNGERPREFNDDALLHVRRLAASARTDEAFRVTSEIEPLVSARITSQATAIVDRVLPLGYSIGSVEGRLEGLNIHGQPQFTVWDSVTGRAVRCYFTGVDLDTVTAAVSHKVLVSGNLRRDPDGRPQQIRPVDFFETIDLAPTTEPGNPVGLFQGMGDPERYLAMIRGD